MVDLGKCVWVGPWESYAHQTGVQGMIVSYGETKGNSHAFCWDINRRVFSRHKEDERKYIAERMKDYRAEDNETHFLFFDQSECAYYPDYKKAIVCSNSEHLILTLNSKAITRTWLRNTEKMLPYIIGPIGSFCWSDLLGIYPGVHQFFIQDERSTGGFSCYRAQDREEFESCCSAHSVYRTVTISPYLESYRVFSQNILISEESIVCFQPSEQLVAQCKLGPLYGGSDYSCFLALEKSQQAMIMDIGERVAKRLQRIGYRGFVGIDSLLYNEAVFFLEINPRFQSSTDMLNKELRCHGLPNVFQLSLDAFYNAPKVTRIAGDLSKLRITAKRKEYTWEKPGDEDKVILDAESIMDGMGKEYDYYEKGVFLSYHSS